EGEHVRVVRELDDRSPEERTGLEIERLTPHLEQPLGADGLSRLGWNASQIDNRKAAPVARANVLHWTAVHRRERGAQRFVPAYDLSNRALEGGHIERAQQTHRGGDVI